MLTKTAFCVFLALVTLILSVDANYCNCCKRKHKPRCPQHISTSLKTTPQETYTSAYVPCNCDPEKCANMTYKYCHCQHDDSDKTVSNPPLPKSGNCSDLKIPCAICWTLGNYYSCPKDVNECGPHENGCSLIISDPGEHPEPGSICPCNCNSEKCTELTQKSEFCYCIQDDENHTTSQYPVPSSRNCSDLKINCSICYKLGNIFYCNSENNTDRECVNEGCSEISSTPPEGPEPGSICRISTLPALRTTTSDSCKPNNTECSLNLECCNLSCFKRLCQPCISNGREICAWNFSKILIEWQLGYNSNKFNLVCDG